MLRSPLARGRPRKIVPSKIGDLKVAGQLSATSSTSATPTPVVNTSVTSSPVKAAAAGGNGMASDGRQPIASPKTNTVMSPPVLSPSSGDSVDEPMGKLVIFF